jgi:hypothetical protein
MNEEVSITHGRFPSSCLPSVEYFICLHKFRDIFIDADSAYQKQTVRNRYFILSPNGIQCLSVPVVHHSGVKQIMSDIKISYAEPWQVIHWRAIQSAYGRSPYFEFFKDELEDIYSRRFTHLIEWNNHLLYFLLKKMKSNVSIAGASSQKSLDHSFLGEARTSKPLTDITFKPYNQVFSYKFGFIQNLSALDLLLNCGNKALEWLV